MNYTELIVKAAEEKDWDKVIQFGNEAKLNSAEQSLFGIKRGFLNFFRITSRDNGGIKEYLKELGYKVYDNEYPPLEEIKDEYFCYFTNVHSDAGKLMKKGFILQFFDFNSRRYSRRNKEKKTCYYVKSSTNKWRFESVEQLKALLRDKRIDSILED